jgi:peptide/nickel transport system substrate-binding protein
LTVPRQPEEEIVVNHRQHPGSPGIRTAALFVVAALAFAACGGSTPTAAPATSSPPASGVPQPSNPASTPAPVDTTFTYGSHSQVVTDLDPATSYSNEVIAMHEIYETLTRYDAVTNKVMPALASAWTSSADGTTWTFTLRSGVTFHTGRAMDAAAAKAAIERTKTLGQGAGYIWGAVKTIEAKDPQTLVFTLDYPAPLDLIASANYAAYIYDTQAAGAGATDEALAAWFKPGKDAGTGPCTITSWKVRRLFPSTSRWPRKRHPCEPSTGSLHPTRSSSAPASPAKSGTSSRTTATGARSSNRSSGGSRS